MLDATDYWFLSGIRALDTVGVKISRRKMCLVFKALYKHAPTITPMIFFTRHLPSLRERGFVTDDETVHITVRGIAAVRATPRDAVVAELMAEMADQVARVKRGGR